MTRFVIFRNGETDWNKKTKHTGWTDIPINHLGRKQASELALKLQNEKIDVFYSSPLSRANETSIIVNNYHNKKIVILDDLKEMTYGRVEGITKKERSEKYPWFRWSNDQHRKKLGMETIAEWKDKLEKSTIPVLLKNHVNQTVALSTHHGKMKVILYTLGFDKKKILDAFLPNCTIIIIEKDKDTMKIVYQNYNSRLQ